MIILFCLHVWTLALIIHNSQSDLNLSNSNSIYYITFNVTIGRVYSRTFAMQHVQAYLLIFDFNWHWLLQIYHYVNQVKLFKIVIYFVSLYIYNKLLVCSVYDVYIPSKRRQFGRLCNCRLLLHFTHVRNVCVQLDSSSSVFLSDRTIAVITEVLTWQ